MYTNWQEYYQQTKDKPSSALLAQALPYVSNKDLALDLGAGVLRDSKFLLRSGFKKNIAVDKEQLDAEFMQGLPSDRFTFVQSGFDEFDFGQNRFDLINAQYSLPFNPPETFPQVWKNMIEALAPGGVFVGQLFGLRDEWKEAGRPMNFHSLDEVRLLLSGLEIIHLEELEHDGKLANGKPKHWHVFDIIAKKPNNKNRE